MTLMPTKGDEAPTGAPNAEQSACLEVYHDGSCPLCQREIALVRKLTADKNLAFVDVSSVPDVGRIARDLAAKDAMARFHVRRADGSLVSGAEAFLEMWITTTPRLAFLKPLASSRIAIALLNGVYRVVLFVRPALARVVGRYDAWRTR